MRRAGLLGVFALWSLTAALSTARAEMTALDRYILAPDPAFGWKLAATYPGDGYTTYVLDLTSQSWRTAADVARPVWKHWLTIVKPDGVRRGLTGEVLRRVEAKGLRISELKMIRIDRDLAEEHYGEHREKAFFGDLVSFITSGSVVVARLEGEQAISVLRTMMGPTDPAAAPPGTIRGDFGTIITENLVHGSDSASSAERELKLFFSE